MYEGIQFGKKKQKNVSFKKVCPYCYIKWGKTKIYVIIDNESYLCLTTTSLYD